MKHMGFRAIIIASFFLLFSSQAKAQADGYMSSFSVAQGEKLLFYISTSNQKFDLIIFKLGLIKKEVLTLPALSGGIQPITDSSFINGCNWKASAEITIPLTWASGVYEADFPSADTMKKLIFIVREKDLGKHSKIVICLTANTWQAYNNWGGRSLYDFNSYSQTASVKISFNRPLADSNTNNYFRWADKLVIWLELKHIDAEFCVNTDLDRDPRFLSHYKVYVPVGHDEYWSKPERNAVETFVNFGGRIICLSGNTCWWQVRFEDSLQTMVCYRDTSIDPMYPMHDSIVTMNWSRSPINDPPNSLFGVSFEHGGFINDKGIFPQILGYGGYTIFNALHWIYEGTGAKDGDVIGAQDAIAGYEADGALYDWHGGFPYVTGEDKTPKNFSILGISPAASSANLLTGHATMGCYTTSSGGAVFNGGSTDWVKGLDGDDSVQSLMLQNIFFRFSSFLDLPPEITSYSPIRITHDSINHEWVNINHLSMPLSSNTIDTFTIHGIGPTGKKTVYFWRIAGMNVGFDSIFILTPQLKKIYPSFFMLEGCASVGYDKAVVSWALLDTTIRFVSTPPSSVKKHAFFLYQAVAASLIDEHPTYKMIYGPSWITIDSRGKLSGFVGDQSGDQTIILRAIDSKGNSDFQTFNIHIADSVLAVADLPMNIANLQCFPNPITDDAHFLFTLEEKAYAEIEVLDMKGMSVCSLFAKGEIANGPHLFEWNRKDDAGRRVASGIYLCRINITSLSGKTASAIEKLVVM
jgi:hypothetical protein